MTNPFEGEFYASGGPPAQSQPQQKYKTIGAKSKTPG